MDGAPLAAVKHILFGLKQLLLPEANSEALLLQITNRSLRALGSNSQDCLGFNPSSQPTMNMGSLFALRVAEFRGHGDGRGRTTGGLGRSEQLRAGKIWEVDGWRDQHLVLQSHGVSPYMCRVFLRDHANPSLPVPVEQAKSGPSREHPEYCMPVWFPWEI